jgi:hypothetical protein
MQILPMPFRLISRSLPGAKTGAAVSGMMGNVPTDNTIPTGDAEADAEINAILARGGPVWIPAEEANAEMERMLAEAEAAEDARAFQEWDDLKATGQARTVPHAQVRRVLGLPPHGPVPDTADDHG